MQTVVLASVVVSVLSFVLGVGLGTVLAEWLDQIQDTHDLDQKFGL